MANADSPPPGHREAAQLFLLGFLTLFLELVLIRYLAGSIWNLGYFPNLVLLSVFTGMAGGFMFHRRFSERASRGLFFAAPTVLFALAGFVRVARPAVPGLRYDGGDVGNEVYFTGTPPEARGTVLLFAACFLVIVAIFFLVSQRTAKVFGRFRPLHAYTLDISGSCAGILLFMAMSFFRLPAWIWFLISLPLFAAAARLTSPLRQLMAVLPLVGVAAIAFNQDTFLMGNPAYQGELRVAWSPYQKVEYINDPTHLRVPQGIYVNGITHQAMLKRERIIRHYYQVPYRWREGTGAPEYRNVLVIGAGSGNDVAAALMNGVTHVDAVEIDPVIADLGRRYHPAQPYSDSRVSLHVDDGRAFMTKTQRRYDLIIFALTDSVVKVSSMSQLRLENYLFTLESFRRAYSLLEENGDLVLYNYYRRSWLIEKFAKTLHLASGQVPTILYQRGDFKMMAVRRAPGGDPIGARASIIPVAEDDWPFPYLRERRLSLFYLEAMLFALGFSILLALGAHFYWGGRGAEPRGSSFTKVAFLLMGVAFLLLETKSIVKFSLLFGTTWLNTSLVFLGILLSVLAANWVATLIRRQRMIYLVYLLLLASCLFGVFFPFSNLLGVDSRLVRFLLASLITFSPIFFANLVFSVTFRDQVVPEHIFGWNLLGATMGGVLEYTSMVLGYNALALIVAGLYTVVAILLIAGQARARGAPGVSAP